MILNVLGSHLGIQEFEDVEHPGGLGTQVQGQSFLMKSSQVTFKIIGQTATIKQVINYCHNHIPLSPRKQTPERDQTTGSAIKHKGWGVCVTRRRNFCFMNLLIERGMNFWEVSKFV